MAGTKSKRSSARPQAGTHKQAGKKSSTTSTKQTIAQQAATQKPSTKQQEPSSSQHRSKKKQKKQKKRVKRPASLRYTETKRGKTTTRRYPGRSFYRFEEAKGKAVDYVEFFTAGEYHCVDISFEDKTRMHLVIEPTFTLTPEYADWKNGNWHPIKRWPLIAAQR